MPRWSLKSRKIIKDAGIETGYTSIGKSLHEIRSRARIYKCPDCAKPFSTTLGLEFHLEGGDCR